MDVHSLTQPDPDRSGLGQSRSRVLEILRASSEPLAVDQIARQLRLHPNTVRFHLDGLVEADLAARSVEGREQPGRPRVLFQATARSAGAGRRSYRLLAGILASYLAGQDPRPAEAATRAGHAWGRYLTERPAPFRQLDAESATHRLVATLDEIGFAAEVVADGQQRELRLHHCPFRETAIEHPEVVCSIHLGLMRGLLEELDAPIDTTRLDPFVEPHLCVAHLRHRPRADGHPTQD